MPVPEGVQIPIQKAAGFLIAETFPVGRIAKEHPAGAFQLKLLKREAGQGNAVRAKTGLGDMTAGQDEGLRIQIRAADPANRFRLHFLS